MKHLTLPLAALAALGLTATAQAQTVVPGPNICNETWSPSGSPYIIVSDCTVPSGCTLTIQPGTIVWIGQGISLTCNGMISAVGTPAQRITFQAPISSQTWNTIVAQGTAGTNQFKYCDFLNATNALDFRGDSLNEVMYCNFSNSSIAVICRDASVNTEMFCSFQNVAYGIFMTVHYHNDYTQTNTIKNCTFSDCLSQAIYGEAIGTADNHWSPGYWSATISSVIQNCSFANVAAGCKFNIYGAPFGFSHAGYGYGNVQMVNNVFSSVTNTAVWLSAGSYAASSPATLINNTMVDVGSGVTVNDPWDAKIQSCAFKGCTSAVSRSGSFSAAVSCNDFFGNSTNFTGYPITYGQVILANRNGTPSDVLFNIFQDPLFVSATDFHLQGTSPCIDAGEGSPANFDSYFPPSLGSITNDIGAYGGPGAGQWIVPSSTNAFTLTAVRVPYVSVTVNPPSAGHYRLEYSSALLGTNNWIQLTNMDLTTVPFTYLEPATSPSRYYRAVKQQ